MTKLAILLILLVASSCVVLQLQAEGTAVEDDKDDAALMNSGGVSEEQCRYSWETHTGDLLFAGTNSDITFTFYNKKGESFSVKIDGNEPGMFEQNKVNKGTFKGKCFVACRVHIESDDWGPAPTWYCDYLKIKVREARVAYDMEFDVHQWIGLNSEPDPHEADVDKCAIYGGVTAASANTSPFSII